MRALNHAVAVTVYATHALQVKFVLLRTGIRRVARRIARGDYNQQQAIHAANNRRLDESSIETKGRQDTFVYSGD